MSVLLFFALSIVLAAIFIVIVIGLYMLFVMGRWMLLFTKIPLKAYVITLIGSLSFMTASILMDLSWILMDLSWILMTVFAFVALVALVLATNKIIMYYSN